MGAGADANETGHGWGRPDTDGVDAQKGGLSGEEASTQVISFARSSRSELEKRLTSGGDG
jgi:hypothetical protein